jgi:nucleotide-binding universal stress UspA family protein
MPKFENILFPVDFSPRCLQSAALVAQLAGKFKAQVHLLHVVDRMPVLYTAPLVPVPDIETYQRVVEDQTRIELANFAKDAFAPLTVIRTVLSGEPAKAIVDYAAGNRIDLIVLPTHGRGAFRRFLLGSVTSKVLHDSNCAVLTTAHAENLNVGRPGFERILCAVDRTSEAAYLIEQVAALATDFASTVRLVYATPALQPTPEFPVDPELRAELEEEARRLINAVQERCGTHFETYVETGDVVPVLRRWEDDFKPSLVVIGRGKLHHRFGQLRTHVSSIIREAPCAVLSLPEHEEASTPAPETVKASATGA